VDADLLGAVYGTSWPQADIDDSGMVDLIDLALLSQNMDATFGTQCMGNINGDGGVDGTDLGILSAVYGTEYPQADLDGVPPVDIIDLTLLAQNTGNLCP
ncbi:MAG: hypothetical protein GY708_09260, partial [Actinomycetia bacterium]|nr:hypothetical protein [Actinomycetes bacterium]